MPPHMPIPTSRLDRLGDATIGRASQANIFGKINEMAGPDKTNA